VSLSPGWTTIHGVLTATTSPTTTSSLSPATHPLHPSVHRRSADPDADADAHHKVVHHVVTQPAAQQHHYAAAPHQYSSSSAVGVAAPHHHAAPVVHHAAHVYAQGKAAQESATDMMEQMMAPMMNMA
jgi:hypothetical protein